jgi:hypothetical protein
VPIPSPFGWHLVKVLLPADHIAVDRHDDVRVEVEVRAAEVA